MRRGGGGGTADDDANRGRIEQRRSRTPRTTHTRRTNRAARGHRVDDDAAPLGTICEGTAKLPRRTTRAADAGTRVDEVDLDPGAHLIVRGDDVPVIICEHRRRGPRRGRAREETRRKKISFRVKTPKRALPVNKGAAAGLRRRGGDLGGPRPAANPRDARERRARATPRRPVARADRFAEPRGDRGPLAPETLGGRTGHSSCPDGSATGGNDARVTRGLTILADDSTTIGGVGTCSDEASRAAARRREGHAPTTNPRCSCPPYPGLPVGLAVAVAGQ